jgi:hypothetical protein|tara:strand:- start:85 stop:366 length:282 start_codon:yes stop_codon:yes gene_type:complete
MWEQIKKFLAGKVTVVDLTKALIGSNAAEFELAVELGTCQMDTIEGREVRLKMARIADVMKSTAQGKERQNWENVAFNLSFTGGNRVARSYRS